MNYEELLFQIVLLLIILNAFYYMATGKFTLLGLDKMGKKIIKSIAEGLIGLIEGIFIWIGELISSLIKAIFKAITPRKRGKNKANNDS